MHLVSWNVASWPTALNLICQQHGSLDVFLERHGIDILALQEVKMQSAVIETALVPRPPSSSGEPRQLHAKGYESFWAPCRATEKAGSKSTSRGFNGVATFARDGWTMRAERDPLGDAALDAEGRCVLTFHGAFAVFNVYVPNASQGSARLPFKVKFLRALRRRMQQVRSEGVAVLLVGDLNISRRRQDSHPDNCRIDVRKAIADAAAGGDGADGGEYMAAARQLQRHWSDVLAMLDTREAEACTIRATHGPVNRFRLYARPPGQQKRVQLGSPFGSESDAMGAFRTDEHVVTDETSGEKFVARKEDTMRATELRECLAKVGVQWSQATMAAVTARAGSAGGAAVCREWLDGLIDEDGMVDSFAELEPQAEGRYTCWCQYTNERYSNLGSRIDYCLVGASPRALQPRCFAASHVRSLRRPGVL